MVRSAIMMVSIVTCALGCDLFQPSSTVCNPKTTELKSGVVIVGDTIRLDSSVKRFDKPINDTSAVYLKTVVKAETMVAILQRSGLHISEDRFRDLHSIELYFSDAETDTVALLKNPTIITLTYVHVESEVVWVENYRVDDSGRTHIVKDLCMSVGMISSTPQLYMVDLLQYKYNKPASAICFMWSDAFWKSNPDLDLKYNRKASKLLDKYIEAIQRLTN